MPLNTALHRIAARLRFCLKPKVHGGAARSELWRSALDLQQTAPMMRAGVSPSSLNPG